MDDSTVSDGVLPGRIRFLWRLEAAIEIHETDNGYEIDSAPEKVREYFLRHPKFKTTLPRPDDLEQGKFLLGTVDDLRKERVRELRDRLIEEFEPSLKTNEGAYECMALNAKIVFLIFVVLVLFTFNANKGLAQGYACKSNKEAYTYGEPVTLFATIGEDNPGGQIKYNFSVQKPGGATTDINVGALDRGTYAISTALAGPPPGQRVVYLLADFPKATSWVVVATCGYVVTAPTTTSTTSSTSSTTTTSSSSSMSTSSAVSSTSAATSVGSGTNGTSLTTVGVVGAVGLIVVVGIGSYLLRRRVGGKPVATGITGAPKQMQDAKFEDLMYQLYLQPKGVERDLSDHTRAFDPKTGQNFAWDSEKMVWIDVKTGQGVSPTLTKKQQNALYEDFSYRKYLQPKGVERDLSDHTRAFDPKTGQNFAWDSEKMVWIDVKTGAAVSPPPK